MFHAHLFLRNKHILVQRCQLPIVFKFLTPVARRRRGRQHLYNDGRVKQRIKDIVFKTRLLTSDNHIRIPIGIRASGINEHPHLTGVNFACPPFQLGAEFAKDIACNQVVLSAGTGHCVELPVAVFVLNLRLAFKGEIVFWCHIGVCCSSSHDYLHYFPMRRDVHSNGRDQAIPTYRHL